MYKKSFIFLALIFTPFLTVFAQIDSAGAGYALKFTETHGSYLNIGDNLNSLNFPFTIEAWIDLPAYPSIQGAIFSSDALDVYSGFWFMVRSNGHLFIEFGDNIGAGQQDRRGSETATMVPLRKWVHVSAVCHSITNIQLYFNGVLQESGPTTGTSQAKTFFHNSGLAEIGDWQSLSGESPFLGQVDEVRIWNTARTEYQIRQNMCSHVIPDLSLVGYWKSMGSLQGSVVIDDAIEPHNGIIVGKGKATTKVVSGAPIGDFSSVRYGSFTNKFVSVTDPSGDSFKVSAITGAPLGVFAYEVNKAPYRTGSLNSYPSRYFGVFCVEDSAPSTFRVTYRYASNTVAGNSEVDARLFSKATDSSSKWIGTGPKPDTADNTIIKNDITANGEFILNFIASPMVLTEPIDVSNGKLYVTPNPVHDKMLLSLSNFSEPVIDLRIVNITGEVIREIQNPTRNEAFNLNIAGWDPGVYFAEVMTSKKNYTTCFLVQ